MNNYQSAWIKKKWNEMSGNEQDAATLNIIRETDTLRAIYSGCAERIIKALFLINSGGVVTVLTYLHYLKDIPGESAKYAWMFISFLLFIIGLTCTFTLVAYDYMSFHTVVRSFDNDKKKFLLSEIAFSDFAHFQMKEWNCCKKIVNFFFIFVLGFASYLLAISGIIVGIIGYFAR